MRKILKLSEIAKERQKDLKVLRDSQRAIFLSKKRVISMDTKLLKSYEEIADLLSSDLIGEQLTGLQSLWNVAEVETRKNEISEEFLSSGLLSKAIMKLNDVPYNVQSTILNIMINISAVDNGTHFLVALGCINSLDICIRKKTPAQKQAMFCLTNIVTSNKTPKNEENKEIVDNVIENAFSMMKESPSEAVYWLCRCGDFYQSIENGNEFFQIKISDYSKEIFEHLLDFIEERNAGDIANILSLYLYLPNYISQLFLQNVLPLFFEEYNKVPKLVLSLLELLELYSAGILNGLYITTCADWMCNSLSYYNKNGCSKFKDLLFLIVKSSEHHPEFFEFMNFSVFAMCDLLIEDQNVDIDRRTMLAKFVLKCLYSQRLLSIMSELPSFFVMLQAIISLSDFLFSQFVEILSEFARSNRLVFTKDFFENIAKISQKYHLTTKTQLELQTLFQMFSF
ncbi:hypothetical protein EIN_226100 [Entamoeba invadens IP1]|uniref:Uncharacterized protein n=1 Tax=Entamoeba invadens IP1 TaxID=370355 RepID=A0A0A1U2F7_ENTIV|nr:hypothetical protein EIN_226100 [Entamoeba invadens IP1]ELP88247.1 hypothetical protein EIN_226100 [Entamoeba invadens IP1]|eukprot:XP_004255018.1 hypothetical protein EIN_226100 [Entamoeba invadens IP1]